MTRRLVAGYIILTLVVLVVLMVPLGITHQHNRDRQHQLHSRWSQHGRAWALHQGWRGTFTHRGHQRDAHHPSHLLTSSGVTTGWMPWAFQ